MSLFKVIAAAFCLVAMMSLSACGFESVYAVKNVDPVNRPAIEITNIPDQDGQYLRNQLIDRLYVHGRPSDAPYELRFTPLQKNVVEIGIRKDATATRGQMQITTHMDLIDRATGHPLLQRDFKNMGSYNLLDSQLATMVSQQDITKSILQELSDDVVTELDLYFRRTNLAGPAQ